jgi:hypothetical protein
MGQLVDRGHPPMFRTNPLIAAPRRYRTTHHYSVKASDS